MSEFLLSGLDGSNPIGFMASLGATLAVSEVDASARLAWQDRGRWRPILATDLTREQLLDALDRDRSGWPEDPAIGLRYAKAAKDDGKGESKGGKVAHDLKPLPSIFRAYLAAAIDRAGDFRGQRFAVGARRTLDYAAAFGTDLIEDNNGNVKPTALHFTAGQQEFLKSVSQLAQEVTRADLEEALFGPWRYARALPMLGWDASIARDYALRATDPSKASKLGVPGADWLAFRSLVFFPVAAVRDELRTAGCGGGWKDGHFTWALWSGWLDVDALRHACTAPDPTKLTAAERRSRGVTAVLRAGIRRSDQGGYGSFMPAAALPPAQGSRQRA